MIYIDATHIRWSFNHGTEEYLFNVLKQFEIQGVAFTLITNSPPPERFLRLIHESADNLIIPFTQNIILRIAFQQILLPIIAFKKKLLCPAYISPMVHFSHVVLVIHDMYAWTHPIEIGLLRSFYWKIVITVGSIRAKTVICISSNTYNQFIRYLPAVTNRAKMCYSGTPEPIKIPMAASNNVKYILCIGLLKTIKNPVRAYKAFCLFNKRHNGQYKLVITGNHQPSADIRKLLETIRNDPLVVLTGFVDSEELAALYSNAALLLFPSLAEGFGLPILEAQQYMCPVVTSNLLPMTEVGGSWPIYCNPLDIHDIAEAIERVIELGLNYRNRTKSVALFNWCKHANFIIKEFGH